MQSRHRQCTPLYETALSRQRLQCTRSFNQKKERKNGACNAGIGEARLHHSDSAAGKGLHPQDAPVKVGTDQDDASFSLYAKLAKAMHIRVTAKKRCAAGRGSHRCMEPTMQNRQRSCWCAPENAEPARAMHAQTAATCLLASKGKRLTHRDAQSRQGQYALLCSYSGTADATNCKLHGQR